MSFLFTLLDGHLALKFTYHYDNIDIIRLTIPTSFTIYITLKNWVLFLAINYIFVQSFLLYISKLIFFYMKYTKLKNNLISALKRVRIYAKVKSLSPGFLYLIIPIVLAGLLYVWLYLEYKIISPWDIFSFLGWLIIILTYVRSALVSLICVYIGLM